MLSVNDIETKLREIKPVLATQFNVSAIGYFGSYATGKFNPDSDLDLLVEFARPVGWNFFTLESFLEKSFGLKIDLVTKNALKERVKEDILSQVKYI
ncbi:nucleotidyltransferase family protein [Mucilaginibacter ginkgonis]|uniref:Nucleotidyltransferase family protein n=1 Tax=Mucilaginibacter ginkgonis TaxID=2682091 RepID=A0A6I4HZF8_9SPHI|nr:nucleotidyltransferase family protein [Mucilaginibacter ginkgonis]QQL48738.1 nucleotidyltransferase family protein [Mucilaginibacter ginkgonis]